MSFKVNVPRPIRRRIAGYGLPDFLLVEVYLRLANELGPNPDLMVRASAPFDGMMYEFTVVDPEHRLTEHVCYFHIMYGQDEQTLEVVNFGYLRRTGV